MPIHPHPQPTTHGAPNQPQSKPRTKERPPPYPNHPTMEGMTSVTILLALLFLTISVRHHRSSPFLPQLPRPVALKPCYPRRSLCMLACTLLLLLQLPFCCLRHSLLSLLLQLPGTGPSLTAPLTLTTFPGYTISALLSSHAWLHLPENPVASATM